MTHNKRYRLKKDLPNVKAGAEFVPVSALAYAHMETSKWHVEYCNEIIENNSGWFELIPQEEDKKERIEVSETSWNMSAERPFTHSYRTNSQVPFNKRGLIEKAIEKVLNDDAGEQHTVRIFDTTYVMVQKNDWEKRRYNQQQLEQAVKKAFNDGRAAMVTPYPKVNPDAGEQGFVWTDEFMKEFSKLLVREYFSLDVDTAMYKFKQSKQQPSSNLHESIYNGARTKHFVHDEPGQYITPDPRKVFEENRKAIVTFPLKSQSPTPSNTSEQSSSGDKGWEIVKFVGVAHPDYSWTVNDDGETYSHNTGSKSFSLERLLNGYVGDEHCVKNGKIKIHSVKQLSTGEVFTVGDEVGYDNWQQRTKKCWAIDHFFIRQDGEMLARSKDCTNVEIVDKWLYKNSPSQPPSHKTEPFQWDDNKVMKFAIQWLNKRVNWAIMHDYAAAPSPIQIEINQFKKSKTT